MVNEINKLIFNSLLKYSAVHLPHVGTLYIKRLSAELNGGKLQAPVTVVDYSSTASAISIVEIIANQASVSIEEADDIYARWHNRTCNESTVSIEGVGTLRNKSFITSTELSIALNRYNITDVSKPKKGSAAKIIVAISISLIITAITWVAYTKFDIVNRFKQDVAIEFVATDIPYDTIPEQPVTETVVVEVLSQPVAEGEEIENLIIETVVDVAKEEGGDTNIQSETGYMVVVGSFETIENAERYCELIKQKVSGVDCRIRPLGRLNAVIAFISEDKAECQEFINSYINYFPQAWIHVPRELK